jgi:arylsulfatase
MAPVSSTVYVLVAVAVVGMCLTALNLQKLLMGSSSDLSQLFASIIRDDPAAIIDPGGTSGLRDAISSANGSRGSSSAQSASASASNNGQPTKEEVHDNNKKSAKAMPLKTEKQITDKPLNIVLFYADDWRHDSIGVANASIVRTPFLDWLSTQGMRFTHNCVTTSVCWISRATLYTGQYVSRHKSDYPQKPLWYEGWNEAWPQILKDTGYHLGHVGKWHFNWTQLVYGTFQFAKSYYGQHFVPNRFGGKTHVTVKNEEDSLAFLKARPKNTPFMLSVCFFAPHSQDGEPEQYFPQEASMSLYANETVELPVSATGDAWRKLPEFFREGNEGRRRWKIRFDEPNKHQRMMKNYYRLISEVDKSSERIYKEVERQGLLDSTMFIFTTDNGLFHAEHQLAGKWYPHQESIRVPLIIKDPRMPKEKIGTVNDDFTLNIDLASTILAAAGVQQPAVMQGRDIADLYLTKDPKWRQEFFYEHPVHLHTKIIPASTALVRKNYKFMTWPDYKVEQLFNLESDPYELEDIVTSADMQDVITEMRRRHDELQKAAFEAGPIDEARSKIQ